MDVQVGQSTERSLGVTGDLVELFARVSGDRNLLHFDADWTARTRFRRLMAQGGITTGLLYALVAMDLPGAGTVFMEQHWNFPAPVFIGDTITARAEVLSRHADKPIARLAVAVSNQDGVAVLTGEAVVYQAGAK